MEVHSGRGVTETRPPLRKLCEDTVGGAATAPRSAHMEVVDSVSHSSQIRSLSFAYMLELAGHLQTYMQ